MGRDLRDYNIPFSIYIHNIHIYIIYYRTHVVNDGTIYNTVSIFAP